MFRNSIINNLNILARKNIRKNIRELHDSRTTLYAFKPQSPVTLRNLYDLGKNINVKTKIMIAQFAHREIAIRIAKRVNELQKLPYGLSESPYINDLINLYENSFIQLADLSEIDNEEKAINLRDVFSSIKEKHKRVNIIMSQGIRELISKSKEDNIDFSTFLDRFYMSRISVRMLMSQYIALNDENKKPNFVGIVQNNCLPYNILCDSIEDTKEICSYHYGSIPNISIKGDKNISLTYIPTHLFYVFFEILKNSSRAMIEGNNNTPIAVTIAEGKNKIGIKISDTGGGISDTGMSKIWTYAYTTSHLPENFSQNPQKVPIAGFGHGLPLSRLYTRYFGGDLHVMSLDGYGTDVYITLNKYSNKDEYLP